MLTRNLAIELAPLGITINSIAPGAIETPINQEIAERSVKLKSVLENIPAKTIRETGRCGWRCGVLGIF